MKDATKRLLDLILSGSALVILSPLFPVIAVAIKLDSPGPVLFTQERVGVNGRLFRIYKFRTMIQDASSLGPGVSASDDPRVTRVGRFLRRSHLDELPQLLNVIKGEMSVVGPRPEMPEYVALYSEEEKEVFSVKPGMTGPSTIAFAREGDVLMGKDDPEEFYKSELLHERVRLDLGYVTARSTAYDLRLLALTLRELLLHR